MLFCILPCIHFQDFVDILINMNMYVNCTLFSHYIVQSEKDYIHQTEETPDLRSPIETMK